MKFTGTPEKTALCFSPWEIRPETPVTITYCYTSVLETTWDSNSEGTFTVDGTPYPTSVKSEYAIPETYVWVDGGDITIQPITMGMIDIKIYYKKWVTEVITSRGAITEYDSDYYNDWFQDEDGSIVPYTVLPLTLPENEMEYKLEDFEIEYTQPVRGISMLADDVWELTSTGTLKMTDHTDDMGLSRNLFRKGQMQVEVPMACTIEDVERYVVENGQKVGKIVTIDIQDWIDDTALDCRGILWHRDFLYVLTDAGLYRFDRWSNFDLPENAWPDIIGNDLTYTANDQFLITKDEKIQVYQIRHDFLNLDRDNDLIRMRQNDPEMGID